MPQADETPDIIQAAIRDGLLQLTDDTEVTRLRDASKELTDSYTQDRPALQRAVYATADPDAGEDDPTFAAAAEVIERQWVTFRAKYPQGAATILRVTALAAISAAIKEKRLAALVWYAGATAAEQHVRHNLTGVWRSIIERAGAETVASARDRWAISSRPIDIDVIPHAGKLSLNKPKRPADGAFSKKIAAAVGPTDKDGQATKGNSSWPNSGQPWAVEFGDRLSGVFDAFGSRMQALNGEASTEMGNEIQEVLKNLTASLRSATRNALKEVIRSQEILERRSLLLWWSRALHSISLDKSYRDLPKAVLPFVVALDAKQLAAPFAPMGIEGLIREVVAECGVGGISVGELAESLRSESSGIANLAKPYAVDLNLRPSLLRYLASQFTDDKQAVWSDPSGTDQEFESGRLAVWIYRNALAHALAYDA